MIVNGKAYVFWIVFVTKAWGPCSAECGQAIQVRNRSVARQPNACGKSPAPFTSI